MVAPLLHMRTGPRLLCQSSWDGCGENSVQFSGRWCSFFHSGAVCGRNMLMNCFCHFRFQTDFLFPLRIISMLDSLYNTLGVDCCLFTAVFLFQLVFSGVLQSLCIVCWCLLQYTVGSVCWCCSLSAAMADRYECWQLFWAWPAVKRKFFMDKSQFF